MGFAAPSRQLPSRLQPLPRHLDRMLSRGNSSQTVRTPPIFFYFCFLFFTISKTADLRKLLRYGHPGPVFDMGNRLAFASSYDRRMRNPSWVKQRGDVEAIDGGTGGGGDYKREIAEEGG